MEYEKVYTATVDPDVSKMENMMNQWCLDLKRNVLVNNIYIKKSTCTPLNISVNYAFNTINIRSCNKLHSRQ